MQSAEQFVREIILDFPEVTLNDIELVTLSTGPVIVVSVQMLRTPLPIGIQQLEKLLQERVGDPRMRLVIRDAEAVSCKNTPAVAPPAPETPTVTQP